MTTTVQTQSEYRDLPLDWLVISPTNPRKTFDEDAMQELAASIRENGVLQPLLVRPRAERSFEIVFGERRYRGAAMAEKETVPVCIRELTDAQVLEAQLIELSIVGKSLLCLFVISARRLYVIDVPGLLQIAGYNRVVPPVQWNMVADSRFGTLVIRRMLSIGGRLQHILPANHKVHAVASCRFHRFRVLPGARRIGRRLRISWKNPHSMPRSSKGCSGSASIFVASAIEASALYPRRYASLYFLSGTLIWIRR
jgi:ParB family chromosome partitioning protein